MRLRLSLTLCAVCLLGVIALLFRQPSAAGGALLCAVAGATAAWLWRDARAAAQAERAPASVAALSGAGDARRMARAVATSLDAALPAHELLETMLQSMREGLLVVDADMRVLLSNRAAGRIFGAARDASLNARRLTELTRNPAVLNAF